MFSVFDVLSRTRSVLSTAQKDAKMGLIDWASVVVGVICLLGIFNDEQDGAGKVSSLFAAALAISMGIFSVWSAFL